MLNRRNTGSGNADLFMKVAIAACIGMLLPFTTSFAADGSGKLETIYHVYVDGEHVGKIDQKSVAQDVMDSKIEHKKDKYKNLSLIVGEDVSFVPERVFDPSYDNDKVAELLKDKLTVKAKATGITIAHNTVGFFKDKMAANEVLKKYKGNYVDDDVLKKLAATKENNEKNNRSTPHQAENKDQLSLDTGESVITDVNFSKEVSLSEAVVSPSKVLTVKEGVKALEKGTLNEETHKVQEGDTLSGIAGEYDLSVEKLKELNKELKKEAVLPIGQKLQVMEYKSFVHVIVKEEKKVEKTIEYDTKVIESDELYKGDKKVKQEGHEGTKVIQYSITEKNGSVTHKETKTEETTEKPTKEIIVKGTKVVPSHGTGELHWPAVGGHVSSNMGMRWGSMHKGMDIAGPSSRTILAADNGTVVSAGWNSGGYGNKIVINHNNGMKTVYAHLSSISVSPGETVEKGSEIGIMGSTGDSTGVHLHFEVYKNGSLENPQDYF
ncbi:M23 family metallopeptidase [Virgibacillus siamensis]|uniref:M23 family metallopeptidase n=1 Tax=Virgibacillus siamensis TaxID=480071 RepID=UPI001FE7F5CF|nr:M23 family metallopeptidase [Virgibacillus siamensis]